MTEEPFRSRPVFYTKRKPFGHMALLNRLLVVRETVLYIV